MSAILSEDEVNELRTLYAVRVGKTEAMQIVLRLGYSEFKGRVLLYGDPRRGIKPVIPPIAANGHESFARMWSRDKLIDELNRA